jgi:hypothetical protein
VDKSGSSLGPAVKMIEGYECEFPLVMRVAKYEGVTLCSNLMNQ